VKKEAWGGQSVAPEIWEHHPVRDVQMNGRRLQMSKHLPPVPPASRSDKGPGDNTPLDPNSSDAQSRESMNFDKQGQQGNSKVNTTNQGYQQDR
jgi:hypothetical protein